MVPRSKQTIVYGAQEIESERMWAQIPGSIAEWKEPLGSTVNRVALDSVNVPVFYLDNNEPLYIFFSLFLMKCSYVHKAQNVSCWILQEKKKTISKRSSGSSFKTWRRGKESVEFLLPTDTYKHGNASISGEVFFLTAPALERVLEWNYIRTASVRKQ